MKNWKIAAILASASLAVAAVWAVQAVRVTVNGKSVGARKIDGAVYVKLADVAKALDLPMVAQNGGYVVGQAGGANAIGGVTGKVGTEIFTGKWKFMVKGVQRLDDYKLKFHESKLEMKADEGMDLIVIDCRFKNAVKESVYMYFNAMADTTLTDTEEHGYKAKWADAGGGVAETILPGAAKDFALVFQVPEGAVLKDLVYSIEPVDIKKYGLTNLRISLQ